ncbi:MAG: hypothetical protein KDJ37_16700 [Hyphomicrobiaceae bacterium]|nr:hypothetical protein [Hyphomicrobiaceae bacterium]
MNATMIGALAGAAFGLVNFIALRMLASRVEADASSPEKRRSASILRLVALADLLIFPILGFFLGPIVLG